MGFESSRRHESERRVMICCPLMFVFTAWASGKPVYTSVFCAPVLASAGIGQDLAYSDFLTLSVCSRNISLAMTSKKKSMCWKLIALTPDQKTAVCDLCKGDIVYNKDQQPNYLCIFVSDTRLSLLPAKKSSSGLCQYVKCHLLLHVPLIYT